MDLTDLMIFYEYTFPHTPPPSWHAERGRGTRREKKKRSGPEHQILKVSKTLRTSNILNIKSIRTTSTSGRRALGPCQMFWIFTDDHCLLFLWFSLFAQIINKQAQHTLFDYVGAPGVLKTAQACIFIRFSMARFGVQCILIVFE